MLNAFKKTFLPGTVLLLMVGCATLPSLKPAKPETPLEGLRVDEILNTNTGATVSFEKFLEDLAAARIVYVGETHTNTEDHRVQQKILESLYERNPKLVLALEMFPREAQPILDRYSKGQISEEEFLKEVDWNEVWGFPFELYRPMLNFAREKRLEILALNAPRKVVEKIASSGLASLSAAEQTQVAKDFHMDDPAHKNYVRQQYDAHIKGGIRDFESFFQAQLAWEETMSETLARRLSKSAGDEQILVLIGKGHIMNRVGVPMLTFKRVKQPFKTVVPMPINYPESLFDPNLADYVWITDPMETPHRPRLGIMLRPAPSGMGLEVLGIAPGSLAEKAGIQKGDILFMIDEIPLQSIKDLHQALEGESQDHELKILRGKREISVPVTISP
jgi:uncharacterized iron-regulated protein